MPRQAKRRRKRYEPGSAYAGHVKPRGLFGVFGNVRLFYIVGAIIMLGSLGIGGIFSSGVIGGGGGQQNTAGFVVQEDGTGTPAANATEEGPRSVSPPSGMVIDTTKRYVAIIKTDRGEIQAELLDDQAPQTVNNFVYLARDQHFYDGLAFFFVETDSHAQAGDPACASGTVDPATCDGGPGYDLSQEAPGPIQAGTLGMINASQFFIALGNLPESEQYTPFARITSGQEVAEQIVPGTVIQSITVQEQ